MSIDVLFIHSAGLQSGSEGSTPFVQQLRKNLGADYNVISLAMPDPDNPSYEKWRCEVENFFADNTSPPILVGHSLGASVLLKYLSEQKQEQKNNSTVGLFLVATPFWGEEDWGVEEFFLRKDFAHYLPPALNIYMYQSLDDDVVPKEHLARYSEAIPRAKIRTLAHGGHTFPHGLTELVDDIHALSKLYIRAQ